MRKMEFYAAVFALAVGMGFTSCTEDEDAASLDGKEIASFHKKCKEKPHKIRWLDASADDARFCNDFRGNVTL